MVVESYILRWICTVGWSSRLNVIWIEKRVVVITLLDHPEQDKDDNVEEILAQEKTSHFATHSWPVQSSVAIDSGINGHDYVD